MPNETPSIYFFTPEIDLVPKNLEESVNPKFYATGLHHWVHFTYCYFKFVNTAHGFNVKIISEIPEEGIIFFHRGWFPANLRPNQKQLFVCMQVDYGKHRYAQVQIIHNPLSVYNYKLSLKSAVDRCFSFTKEVFIPSWPQPGLIPRSTTRTQKIENVCFMGHAKNLPKELRTSEWLRQCEALKVNFRIISETEKWFDFSDSDLILSMRSFGKRPYYNKPFLKITNAIFAGVPVIATPESSHLYLKEKKKVDFQIVNNTTELAASIQRIKENPCLEFKKVETNRQLIREYDFIGVFRYYEKLFNECENTLARWSSDRPLTRFLYFKSRQFGFPRWMSNS